MYKRGILSVIILFIIYMLTGCSSVDQTIYLQDVHVSGSVNQPPLHVTAGSDSDFVTLSPKIFINTAKNLTGHVDGHSKVNKNGIYQVDTVYYSNGTKNLKESSANTYEFPGNNFSWSIPDASAGVDFNIRVSRVISFFGGVNYSYVNQESLTSGSIGLGFSSKQNNHANRFDFGALWQEVYYDAISAVVTTYHEFLNPDIQTLNFYRDRDKTTTYNFFGTWTYNTINPEAFLNYYFGLGLFGQTIVDIKPSKPEEEGFLSGTTIDNRSTVMTTYFLFNCGIYKNLDEHSKIILGLRILKESGIKNLSQSLFILPSLQIDMSF